MFNPPRPTINKDIIEKAAEVFVEENIHSLPDDIEAKDLVEHLVKNFASHKNGFELAKDLEWEGWDISAEIVQLLDDFDTNIQDVLQIAEKEWLETNNIQPPLKIGTEVIYTHGEMKTGIITGIYKHRVGCYEIKADGHDDNKDGKMRNIVKWEYAEELSK